ncbi:hypothetical protein PISMIDRAFT_686867, partial [Pisolithus microcarpus 441]
MCLPGHIHLQKTDAGRISRARGGSFPPRRAMSAIFRKTHLCTKKSDDDHDDPHKWQGATLP